MKNRLKRLVAAASQQQQQQHEKWRATRTLTGTTATVCANLEMRLRSESKRHHKPNAQPERLRKKACALLEKAASGCAKSYAAYLCLKKEHADVLDKQQQYDY